MMRWTYEAWPQDTTQQTIRNCWRKAKIVLDECFEEAPHVEQAAAAPAAPTAAHAWKGGVDA
jgi:hypothetical protein